MNQSRALLALFFVSLVSIQIQAQLFGGGERGPMAGGMMNNPKFQRFRQMLQNLNPQQRTELRQIFMANRGNRPAMRAQFESWASRQGGQVQDMFQRYKRLKADGNATLSKNGRTINVNSIECCCDFEANKHSLAL
ncbi:hypothetical protein M3Y97_01000800 [Aphelenchoides bicaudatus]|nr:hypothetical protein M3Y97_01000800 [Aphelenchoides bicaudatus]